MRRALSLILVLAMLVVVAPAAARPTLAKAQASNKSYVALTKGRGTAVLTGSGTVWGYRIVKGSIRIVDLPGGARTKIRVKGYEHVRRVNARTKVYTGREMTFSVSYGRWRVQIVGRGINVSAVMRGRLALRGSAGRYRIDDGPSTPWPTARTVFSLA